MLYENRYIRIIEHIFLQKYAEGMTEVPFERGDIISAAEELQIPLPKNIGDVIYSARYRTRLPRSILDRAPSGKEWVILPAGRSRYRFVAVHRAIVEPNRALAETKVPDCTPGIVALYAMKDEQALLARLRYNRLIDVFTGVTCYSLQSHLRTTVQDIGQIETDEIYVGIDRRGAHYVIPVQVKTQGDRISIVQIAQDIAMCSEKFPDLICIPIAAQFLEDGLIAVFSFEQSAHGVSVVGEKHYRLVPPSEMSPEDIRAYRSRLPEN